MALKVGELFALFTIDSSGVTTAMGTIQQKLDSLSTSFARAGSMWTASITRPIASFAKKTIETSMNFDDAMQAVFAVSGLNKNIDADAAKMNELRETAKELGATTVFTAEQAAGAFYYMGMAGWSTEAMLGGIKPVVNLAAASGEDIETVSDIVTDSMTAMGYTLESVGGDSEKFGEKVLHFTDVLATAATHSNTNVGKMGESFKYAATVAGSLGYNIEDVAIILGLLANRGIKSTQAGTTLRKFLNSLVSPTEKGAKVMADFGITLTDTEGNMLPFLEVMKQCRAVFGDLNGVETSKFTKRMQELDEAFESGTISEEEYEAKMEEAYSEFTASVEDPEQLRLIKMAYDLGGVRGMPALLAIVNASDEEFNGLTEAIYNCDGAAQTMSDTMLDSSKGKFTLFTSAVDSLKISVGELTNEAFTGLLEKATEIIQNFINLDDETKMAILKMIGLAAAIGPALIGLGLLLKLAPMIGSAFGFLASPFGIVIALLAAMAFAAMDADGTIGKALSGIGEALGIDLSGFSLSDINVTEMLDGFLGGVEDLANNPAVTGFISRLGQGLIGALSSLGDIAGQIIAYILSPEGLSKIYDAGMALGNLLLTAIGDALYGIFSFFTNLIDRVLISWGLIDEEAREKLGQNYDFSAELNAEMVKSFDDAVGDLGNDDKYKNAVLYALFGDFDSFGKESKEKFLGVMNETLSETEWGNFDWFSEDLNTQLWTAAEDAMAAGEKLSGAKVKEIVAPFLKAIGLTADAISDEAYEALAVKLMGEGVGAENDFLVLLLGKVLGTETPEEAAEKAKTEAVDTASQAANELIDGTIQSVGDVFAKAVSGASGLDYELTVGKGKVETSADEVSDAAVKKFLLKMSNENGKQIASTYIAGMIDGMKGAGLDAAAGEVAQSVENVFIGIFSYYNGFSIGVTYGRAIGDGIQMALASVNGLTFNGYRSTPFGIQNGNGTQNGNNQASNNLPEDLRNAMNGVGVFMDRERVGSLVADVVDQKLAQNANGR